MAPDGFRPDRLIRSYWTEPPVVVSERIEFVGGPSVIFLHRCGLVAVHREGARDRKGLIEH